MYEQLEIADLAADIREQALYMRELGVDGLAVEIQPLKRREFALEGEPERELSVPSAIADVPSLPKRQSKPAMVAGARIAALPSLAKRPAFGQPTPYNSGDAVEDDIKPVPDTPKLAEPTSVTLYSIAEPPLSKTVETIEMIRADIGDCTRCPLCAERTQIVHSAGNFQADLMFVGEAPGADEDAQGFPFVGRAGQLLTKIIEGIGIKREEVFIGNINRCRPPGNRQPTLPEAESCRPFLQREIAVVRPKVIVVMGNTAAQNLLNTKVGISRIRGTFQDYLGVKLMPTFHPAYLLRDPHKKREVWEDMKKVRDYLQSQS